MNMLDDALYNRFFIIDIIVSDNDRTIRAVLKHPSKGAQGQVLKSSKGKLDEEIPEPSFLTYPSHNVKVVAKHIFYMVDKIRAQRCVCTKTDVLQLKTILGVHDKKEWGKIIEELNEASRFPLEHMFNNDENFSVEWYFKTRASE